MLLRLRLFRFTHNFAMISIKSRSYPNSFFVPAQNGELAPADGRKNSVSARKFRYCKMLSDFHMTKSNIWASSSRQLGERGRKFVTLFFVFVVNDETTYYRQVEPL